MNNKIICVLQENENISRKYIWYYKYKQDLSNISKYVFKQGFVCEEVRKINTNSFRTEATLLRKYRSTYISKILTM